MSQINEIKKKIYQRKSDIDNRKLGKDSYDPTEEFSISSREDELENIRKKLLSQTQNEEPSELSKDKLSNFVKQNQKTLIIGLGIFSFIFLLVAGFLLFAKYKENLFNPENIFITFQGPEQVKSGSTVKYILKIESKNRAKLLDTQARINFSKELKIKDKPFLSNSQFGTATINIGNLDSHSQKEYEIEVDVFGAKDTQGYIEADFSYNPENFNSRFENKGQLGFMIESSALELTLIPTREASSGEIVEIQAVIENKGENVFENVTLAFDYPMNFNFLGSQPEPSEKNNYWLVGNINQGEQKEVIIRGNLTGEVGAIKNFYAKLGQDQGQGNFLALTSSEALIKITSSRLRLANIFSNSKQFKSVKAGDVVFISLKFKNTSDKPLRDLILTENISSPAIDKAGFSVRDGYYDSASEKIIWKASQIPSLKILNQQEEGQVDFSFRVKNNFPMESETDKNFIVSLRPEIESLDVDSPLGPNKKVAGENLAIKVESLPILDIIGSYKDDEISNSGPFHPQVGEKTTLTMKFNLRNTSNDLKDVEVHINLAAGISWENKFLPNNQKVEFNERTNELIWKLGTVSAGTGFIYPMRNLAFQIGLIPSENQMGSFLGSVILISGVKVIAQDTFTGDPIEYYFKDLKLGELSDF